jgi:hypothetical protein
MILQKILLNTAPPKHPPKACLDILHAKQEALDRDVPFAFSREALCSRCRRLFSAMNQSILLMSAHIASAMVAPVTLPLLYYMLIRRREKATVENNNTTIDN